ncbi:MAG TPA: hypothetical protein VGJ15_07595 [Pirellulales bacterium]|jgi:hypothetical protein
MADEHSRIRHIAWTELFPWLGLMRAVRLAFAPRMIILAALGLAATAAGWRLVDSLFGGSHDNAVSPQDQTVDRKDQAIEATIKSHALWPTGHLEPEPPARSLSMLDPANSPATIPWDDLSRPFRELFGGVEHPMRYGGDVTLKSFTYMMLCGVWALLVWSLFGAAISRGAALWFAREDRLSFRHALAWGVKKWPAYFGGPMFPLAGVIIAVVPVAVLALLLKFDLGVVLVGIIWPVVLACGLFLAILLVGLLFGWPLMWPTVSTEGTDSFDALSRSYSYTYQRPLHYLFYAAVAGILGMLAWIVVVIFANGVITYSFWAASWGSGGSRMTDIIDAASNPDTGGMLGFGAHAIGFWVQVVRYLAVGFLFSYFWCAATYIYFLLRQSVDATEMDEVAFDEQAELHNLPPLSRDTGSVPQVVDPPAAQ